MRRKISVTEQNISSIPLSWITVRYGQLKKQLRTTIYTPELMEESKLIASFLTESGNELDNIYAEAEQLELSIPQTKKEEYVPLVEELLEQYYLSSRRIKVLERDLEHLLVQYAMPAMTASYSGMSSGNGEVSNPIESEYIRKENRAALKKNEIDELKSEIEAMDRALSRLSGEQLELIQKRYLVRDRPYDYSLIGELKYNRQKYYQLKHNALCKMATSLKII
jgi:ArpU family phage transcriptional regulator